VKYGAIWACHSDNWREDIGYVSGNLLTVTLREAWQFRLMYCLLIGKKGEGIIITLEDQESYWFVKLWSSELIKLWHMKKDCWIHKKFRINIQQKLQIAHMQDGRGVGGKELMQRAHFILNIHTRSHLYSWKREYLTGSSSKWTTIINSVKYCVEKKVCFTEIETYFRCQLTSNTDQIASWIN